jgi:formylglycine-generating enzyme required for sulfatase activity
LDLTATELQNRAEDLAVARLMLSEIHHYDGTNGMLAHYGIATPASEADVIAGLRKVMPIVAAKAGLEAARSNYVVLGGVEATNSVLKLMLQYGNLTKSKAAAILAGKLTSCQNIELGELNSLQFIRDPNYSYLISAPANKTLDFSATYSPSASVVGYEFNFGDGTILASDIPAASHLYNTTGFYYATVAPVVKQVNGSVVSCRSKQKAVGFRVDDLKPRISSVQPLTAPLGVATSFTVSGRYLPLTSVLSIADATCQTPTNRSALGFTVQCTLGGLVGDKVVTIKTDTLANGGAEINQTNLVAATQSGTIELPATAFVRGVKVALSANGYGADTLMNAPPYTAADNAAEWDFNVATAGKYELFATYASGESRPVSISFNGKVVFSNALSAATGGFYPANRQTLSQGTVELPAGKNVMRVFETGANVFPHIKGFSLVPVKTPAVIPEFVPIPGKNFSMSKYEITFAQYDAYADETGVAKPSDEGWGRGNLPVINVSWNDAVAYAAWLSNKAGKSYRLPSGEEWEFAAKAGTKTLYWWGNEIGVNNANCWYNYCDAWLYQNTAPVGSFAANPFGLYDMNGNVAEWTTLCPYVDGCDQRAALGGAWSGGPQSLIPESRSWPFVSDREYIYGIRLVRDN